jgi:hypothetical protein
LAAAVSGAKAELEPVMIDITDMITARVNLWPQICRRIGVEAIGGLISGHKTSVDIVGNVGIDRRFSWVTWESN